VGIATVAKIIARLTEVEQRYQTEQVKLLQQVYQLLNEVIELRQRVETLEAKRGPGRPRKDE
jgi:hypothetical protein